MIFYHNTARQPSSVSVPSPKTIGGLIGSARLLSQHHLGRILGSKNRFLPAKNLRFVSKKFLTSQ